MSAPHPTSPAARAYFALTACSLAAALLGSAILLALLWSEPGTLYLRVDPTPAGTQTVRYVAWHDGIGIVRHAPPAAPSDTFYPAPPRGCVLACFALPIAWLLTRRPSASCRKRDRGLAATCAFSPCVMAILLRNPDPPSTLETVFACTLIAALAFSLLCPASFPCRHLVPGLTR